MQTTNKFGLKLYEGTDLFNPLTVENDNMQSIATQMEANQSGTVGVANQLLTGSVHAITRITPNASMFRFTATSRFTVGDSFTVDGVSVTALMPNGTTIPDGAFVIGSTVLCSLVGQLLTIYSYGIAEAEDSKKLGGKLPNYYATKGEVDNAKKLAEGAATVAQNATTVAQNSINKVNKLDIANGFIANQSNAKYKKMGKLVFVNGFILVNGTNVTFTLPYTAVERVVFPTVGVSADLNPSSGYVGVGDCREGSTSCHITITSPNTYAIVNFVYETN